MSSNRKRKHVFFTEDPIGPGADEKDIPQDKRPFNPALLYATLHRDYEHLFHFIPHLSLKHRSTLIKLCQAQIVPVDTQPSPLLTALKELPNIMFLGSSINLFHFCHQYTALFESPVLSAVTLDLLRGIKVAEAEVLEGFRSAIYKELKICEMDPEAPCRINFAPLFDEDAQYESVLPELPPNPYMARFFRKALIRWRDMSTSKIHYPRRTDKTMSQDTRRVFNSIYGGTVGFDQELPHHISQKAWLRHYHKTGEKVEGGCEMRVRWYESNAKPRAYYAMGGTHYDASMYLQDCFTDLVNTQEMTHHITRLQPNRVRLKFGQHLRIYDFISFTSMMSTQKSFLHFLAEFCVDWPFTYFDPRKGLVTEDFGDVLHRYNDVCNIKPRLSYDRVAKKAKIAPGTLPRHNVASMLGIFGNLMSCTFLHASIVGQAVEDETQGVVAGDDASFAEDEENQHYIDCAACSIGVYERTKSYDTLHPPCVALKRPIRQVPGTTILISGFNIIPPSLIQLLKAADPSYHDSRYTTYEIEPRLVHLNRLGKSLFRFLRVLHFRRDLLREQDLLYGLEFAHIITRQCKRWGDDVQFEGCMPQLSSSEIFWPLVPDSLEDLFEKDPLHQLINAHYEGIVEVTLRGEHKVDDRLRFCGDTAQGNSTKWISLMVDLGYIKSEISRVELRDEVGYFALVRLFNDPQPVLYNFDVLKDIPDNLLIHN